MKPKKFGILLRVLCNARTNYIHDFKMCKGKEMNVVGGKIIDLVKDLTKYIINESKRED